MNTEAQFNHILALARLDLIKSMNSFASNSNALLSGALADANASLILFACARNRNFPLYGFIFFIEITSIKTLLLSLKFQFRESPNRGFSIYLFREALLG